MLALFVWTLRRGAGERSGDLIAPPPRQAPPPAPASVPAASAPETVELPEELRQELWKLIHTGNPIMAIKLVRDRTGLGLKEAHDYVEAMRRNDVTLR